MSTGDSTLMMLLSLNLLLLVFFMLLNSMATYGKRHADEVLAEVRAGYNLPGQGNLRESQSVPEVAMAAWRAGIVSRLQGVVTNRIDLITPPQQGSAGKVEMVLPVSALFDANGKLAKGEVVRNIAAAAGSESRVTWQVVGNWNGAGMEARVANMVAQLAVEAGSAESVMGKDEALKVLVVPGLATKAAIGVQVQQVGEEAGGNVRGVEEKGNSRE